MRKQNMELFVRCASGFEKTLAHELCELGLRRVRPLAGGVAAFGTKHDAYATCLWSRVATRVQLVVARVDAGDTQQLYTGTRGVAWEKVVRRGATIAVRAHGTNDALRNTAFTALKVKDALCDRLRDAWGERPNVDARHPDLEVNVALHERKATLYLNLSGGSLHRRGYRQDGVQTAAPLKETLAAGMLLAAGWRKLAREGASFVDPMCGSGTLAIEAALIAGNVAPGLLRTAWGFGGWAEHEPDLWEDVLCHAREARISPAPGTRIFAGDVDKDAVRIAARNAERAGVDGTVQLFCDDAANLRKHIGAIRRSGATGLLACNPPYGERLQESWELAATYQALGQAVEALPEGWQVVAISPDGRIDTLLAREPTLTIPCYNGPIHTWVRAYDLADEQHACDIVSLDGRNLRVPIADPHSAQFAARLRKVARDRGRWARRTGIGAYRIYEADLPDFPYAIDVFVPDADAAGDGSASDKPTAPYVLMREVVRPKASAALAASRRLCDAEALVAGILGLPQGHVVVRRIEGDKHKPRTHDHASAGDEGASPRVVVREAGLRHVVSMAQPDDTLPLVLREARGMAASQAHDKRVACVFATDVACVAELLARGPASLVVVDAREQNRRLVEQAFAINGMRSDALRFRGTDPLTWAQSEARAKRRYDLVVCVAPEWIVAHDNGGREWSLGRDHKALVLALGRILAPGGSLLFATTQLAPGYDPEGLRPAGLLVRDVTANVLPDDFAHTRIPLRCLEFVTK